MKYEYARRSPPAFVAAYGERGFSGCSSSIGARSAVPYTSLEEMRMKRSTGVARIASSRICVPSTFVVTNSDAPSAIDFSTWDSAAAFTITSTSATTWRTSSASRMSPWTNESRSCDIAPVRLSRLPAYVSASRETTSYGVFLRRWWMKLDGMKPAPPVTRTRLDIACDVVRGRLNHERASGYAFGHRAPPGIWL